MSRFSPSLSLGAALGALWLLAATPVSGQPAGRVRDALDRMEMAAGSPVEVTLSRDTGLVTFLSVDARSPVPVVGARVTSPEEIARTFLGDYAGAFGFRDAASELELRGPAWRDALGQEHVRFRQVVRGVPVTAGEIAVHLRGSDVLAVNAETLPDLESFDTTPAFFADQALGVARKLVASPRIGVPDAELSAPRLEILNRGLLEGGRQPSRLAWFLEASGPALREYIWIDAKRGSVLLHFSQLPHALNRQVYDSNSTSLLPGTLVRSEGEPPSAIADADLAYEYSGDTYDYFLTQHGRDSYDGAGAPLKSSVRYCRSGCPYANAFWNGNLKQMVYGAGFPAADDVAAHELTHAVTERTADLFYYMQSGALNESFSDIFGETVDLTNGAGTDTPAVRWKMGEDVPGFGAIRDMMDPVAFNDPGRVSDPQYYCSSGDSGGVHHNSGVPNHFYALLADGGTYNSQTVAGIGLTKAGKIAYRALSVHLLSGSGFQEAASAFSRSCADLAGTAGITVADCQQVQNALAAVEMTGIPPCPQSAGPIPPLCPSGQGPQNAFYDDFESGWSNPNWGVDYVSWDPAWFYASFGFTTSGKWHLTGYNWDIYEDSSAFMKSSVTVPANARMQFNHFWDFDPPNLDGGVVEYSLDGGTSWIDASPLFAAGANYPASIYTGQGNPLSGRPAYVGTSHRHTGTQYDLSTLAGQSVKFRFRIGTAEDYYGWWGWDIDDVRIYTCATCTYSLPYTQGFVGAGGGSGTAEVSTQPGCTWTASSDAAWLTVTPAEPGSGKVGYTAEANPTGAPRSATLTLGDQTFTVHQGGETDFYTVAPCRFVDTRAGTALLSGAARTFAAAGLCGIPATARAVSVNLTSVSPTGLGYVTLFPGGVARPLASSINFAAGTTRANNAIVTLSPDGAGEMQGFAFVAGGGTVHLIVDVNGYFE